jgi:hypothetical protein
VFDFYPFIPYSRSIDIFAPLAKLNLYARQA